MPRSRRASPGRRSLAARLGFGALKLAVLLSLWVVILGAGLITYFAFTLPDTRNLTTAERRPSVTIVAQDGTLLATFGDLFGEPLTLKEMPPFLPQAVIATEDRRFYSHFGIDPIGLVRAAFVDLTTGRLAQGGSTITQQLAKNLFLTPERRFTRKIQETLLALQLERRFTKSQILEIYLNRVYLGAGTYGVDAAAHRYFGKSARKLTLYESAVLAGLLKAPTRFSPTRDRDKAAGRAQQVLANMVEAGFISAAEGETAVKQGAALASVVPTRPGNRYFADWAAEQARDFAGASGSDLTVVTTLDRNMQALAESMIGDLLARDGAKFNVGQGALVAMTPDGAVRAMVGGRDYNESQFNRATQAQRQPGSAFKPFVYLAGLEAGLRPYDHLVDAPIRIGNWQPHNYTNRYLGDISLAEALAQSINTIAVQVSERAGRRNVVGVAHRLGIASNLEADPSLALGTNEVNLLELVSAYAPFANGGTGIWPYGISEIRDGAGKVLFKHEGSGVGRVIAPEYVGTMNEMLGGVISRGTGKPAALPRPVAGKTGTTQEYKDAWFIGYTADLVTGVWLGNDDNTPMNRVTGGSLPALAWHNFMLAATRAMPVKPLPAPAPLPAASAATATPGPSLAAAPPPAPPTPPAQTGDFIGNLIGGLLGGGPAPAATPPPVTPPPRGRVPAPIYSTQPSPYTSPRYPGGREDPFYADRIK